MTKTLTVATAVQQRVFQYVIMNHIRSGFWKDARPAEHAQAWEGVEVVVGPDLGPSGFTVPRNYNFVNPDFFRQASEDLFQNAIIVDPNITIKQLKKQLISLNQVIGGRLTEVGGSISKLPRGRKQGSEVTVKTKAQVQTKKVMANFVEPDAEAA